MGIQLSFILATLLAGGLLIAATFVFDRVRSDYRAHSTLTGAVAVLQTGYFFAYALSSCLFLDARFSAISCHGKLCFLVALLMIVGLILVLLSMPILGRRSFGTQTGELYTSGIYRFSRNPQLVGSLLFIAGYALLWPSWAGLLWVSLWFPISYLMVMGEEEHLARVFGREYEEYCRLTPRYIGIPKKI